MTIHENEFNVATDVRHGVKMYKKFGEEQLTAIISSGINEFADKGYEGANLSHIAKSAGVSVGVIYKYFDNKEKLFLACVRDSLKELDIILRDALNPETNLEIMIATLVHELIAHSKEHTNVVRMYHEITRGNKSIFSKELVYEIEETAKETYTMIIKRAQETKMCRDDLSAEYLAFFLDSLFMMIQFAYGTDYYSERYKMYCGNCNSSMEHELTNFIIGAVKRG